MLRTKRAIQWHRSYSALPGAIEIPAGAPVIKGPAADGSSDHYWLDPSFFAKEACIERSDAAIHGCEIDADNVEEFPTPEEYRAASIAGFRSVL